MAYYLIKTKDGVYYQGTRASGAHSFTFVPWCAKPMDSKEQAAKLARSMQEQGYRVSLVKVAYRTKASAACPDCGAENPESLSRKIWLDGLAVRALHQDLSELIAKAIDLPPNPEVSAIIEVLIQLEQGAKEAGV